ncbi:MAG: hut operon positive regulator HutP [Bacilli bacterium]|nr:hut operon positive regulator HutP [Bacilli bacterium]
MVSSSLEVAKAAITVAMTSSREEEYQKIEEFKKTDIKVCAVDVGGNLLESIPKIIERAIVASRRTNVVQDSHVTEGAVAGATREAIMQVAMKAIGLNVGGKIGLARKGEHLSVCIFMSIGLLHLNEIAIGLAHRSIPE